MAEWEFSQLCKVKNVPLSVSFGSKSPRIQVRFWRARLVVGAYRGLKKFLAGLVDSRSVAVWPPVVDIEIENRRGNGGVT